MNDNENIKKQLEVKNKEIYHNKLKIDLDNNLEVLVLTVNNLTEKLKEESIDKILEINESFLNKSEIEEKIKLFMNSYQDNLLDYLDDKKQIIEADIAIIENINPIKEKLDNSYKNIENKIINSSKGLIETLEINLKDKFDTEFKLKRLNDYLNNIFLANLNNKILDIIKNRDIMLFNTFNETYLRFLELNKNTIGV